MRIHIFALLSLMLLVGVIAQPSTISSTVFPPDSDPAGRCGDGVVDPGEDCDDGLGNANVRSCTKQCFWAQCGDGFRQRFGKDGVRGGGDDEQCDDGNNVDFDGCSATCQLETFCGDGRVQRPNSFGQWEDCEPLFPLGDLLCTARCEFRDITFGYDKCPIYTYDELRNYCNEPVDGGPPPGGHPDGGVSDAALPAIDPDPCANRGDIPCESALNLKHSDKGTPYYVRPMQPTYGLLEYNATVNNSGARPADIVYILDRSGSMDNPDPQGIPSRKVEKARTALNSVHNLLRTTDQAYPTANLYKMGLSTFNHDDQVNKFLDYVDFSGEYISPFPACGCTAIGEGLEDAYLKNFPAGVGPSGSDLSCQNGSVSQVIVIASDGIQNRPAFLDDVRYLFEGLGAAAASVTVHAIGVGADAAWGTQLAYIARNWGAGNGVYVSIPAFEQLYGVYESIARIYTGGAGAASLYTIQMEIDSRFDYLDALQVPGADRLVETQVNGQVITWLYENLPEDVPLEKKVYVRAKAGTPPGVYNFVVTSNSFIQLSNGCGDKKPIGEIYVEVLPDEGNGPFCGDGRIDGGEVCDDGNRNDDDFCNNMCEWNDECVDCILINTSIALNDTDMDMLAHPGDIVNITGFVNDASVCDADSIQVDAGDEAANCRLGHVGMDMSGVWDVSIRWDGNEFHGNWTVPEVPPQCFGETVNATFARLWTGAPDTSSPVANPVNATGNLTFFEPVCGDGDVHGTEQCDDGNTDNNDGCDSLCQIEAGPVCGNDVREGTEKCNDGNLVNGDGCSDVCELELICLDVATCGDGNVDFGEQCDDGNNQNGDGCSANCVDEVCGDGIVHAALGEECEPSLYPNCGPVGAPNECERTD